MDYLIGLLKIRVRRGTNLVVRDTVSSDPYVDAKRSFYFHAPRYPNSQPTPGQHVALGGSVALLFFFNEDIISHGIKMKTRVVKKNCNPVWNEELTLSIKDPNVPIILTVYDKDTFSDDDKMGDAEIDIKPYIECMKMGLENLPTGTKVDRVQPNRTNCLSDESCIIWDSGKMFQDMSLRLRNVDRGEVEIQIQWIDLPAVLAIEYMHRNCMVHVSDSVRYVSGIGRYGGEFHSHRYTGQYPTQQSNFPDLSAVYKGMARLSRAIRFSKRKSSQGFTNASVGLADLVENGLRINGSHGNAFYEK
ncbi:hypothetical protein HYC85_023463 [Camellia sinensis]|uniref:C2 domain-containing protein n=1 Tax=Camellia sinensis TaxID=4442 RepID=A0A7J7GIG7_CAMSI|nr:hypothetical protein HYC85_023463 [Camellia sinensis]